MDKVGSGFGMDKLQQWGAGGGCEEGWGCGFVTKWTHGCHRVPQQGRKGVFGYAYRICGCLFRQRQWGRFLVQTGGFFWYIWGFFRGSLGGFFGVCQGVFGTKRGVFWYISGGFLVGTTPGGGGTEFETCTLFDRSLSPVPCSCASLTFIGDCKTLMFVNVSPVPEHSAESLCSLRFAAKAGSCEVGTARRNITLREPGGH